MGDERSVDLLKRIIATNASRWARLAAHETVSVLSTPTWEEALNDSDLLVRTVARQELESLEAGGEKRNGAPARPRAADAAE